MQSPDRVDRVSDLQRRCRARGVPLTPQRRAVFEALLADPTHPAADRVYETVRRTIPGISPATVYRVLEFLVEVGVARKTCSPGSQCRYDARVTRHHHLVCLCCERMVDLSDPALDDLPIPDPRATGFAIEDYSVQFRGICPACSKARRTSRRTDSADDPSRPEGRKHHDAPDLE